MSRKKNKVELHIYWDDMTTEIEIFPTRIDAERYAEGNGIVDYDIYG